MARHTAPIRAFSSFLVKLYAVAPARSCVWAEPSGPNTSTRAQGSIGILGGTGADIGCSRDVVAWRVCLQRFYSRCPYKWFYKCFLFSSEIPTSAPGLFSWCFLCENNCRFMYLADNEWWHARPQLIQKPKHVQALQHHCLECRPSSRVALYSQFCVKNGEQHMQAS